MNIEIEALRAIVADKGISMETVLSAIESALLTAYRHTEGHEANARIDINQKTGVVRVMATETDTDGNVISEWDDTPEGFGRIAATTARQVVLQRLRDAENEKSFGEFSTHEGDIVGGVVQRDARMNARGTVVVRIGSEANGAEGLIPSAEQVPGESYEHGDRIKCYVYGVSRGSRGPQITLSRTHPNLVRRLFALEVPEIADGSVEIVAVAREAGHRSKIAVRSTVPGVNAKGACIGPMGQRVRNVMSELAGEKIDIIDLAEDPAAFVGNALSAVQGCVRDDRRSGGSCRPGRGPRFPAVAGDRQGRPECSARRTIDGLAHRYPVRRHPRRGRISAPAGPARVARGRASGTESGATRGWMRRSGHGSGTVDTGSARVFGIRTSRSGRNSGDNPTSGPVRTCVGCRKRELAADLLRIVAQSPGSVPIGDIVVAIVPDPRRRLPGRGAWLHPVSSCLSMAERRRAFGRALRVSGNLDISALEHYVENRHEHS